MSRWDLLDLMKQKRKFLTESDLVKITKKSQPSINNQLRSLVKGRRIEVKKKPKKIRNSVKTVKHYRFRR